METTGQALVDHWSWAAEKGVMNKNTAFGRRAACVQVLSILEGWEAANVAALDIEDLLRRFQNLKAREYKPSVLEAYKKRFRSALASFLEYVKDPSSWRAPQSERPAGSFVKQRSSKANSERGEQVLSAGMLSLGDSETTSMLVEFKFPIRSGIVARLFLPATLTAAEAKKVSAFIHMLVPEES